MVDWNTVNYIDYFFVARKFSMESSQVGEKANFPFKEVMYDGYVKLFNVTDYIYCFLIKNLDNNFSFWFFMILLNCLVMH